MFNGITQRRPSQSRIPNASLSIVRVEVSSIVFHFQYEMTRFRPCIDLHSGQVKQIVGGTLTTSSSTLQTNFVSTLPATHFAQLYKDNACDGAHVIMLGPGNEEAAESAVKAWEGGLQVGGGINEGNARTWVERGAGKVGCFL